MRHLISIVTLFLGLNANAQMQLIFSVTPPSCVGCADASIETTFSGCMVGAYTLSWYGPNGYAFTVPDIIGITEGTFIFSVVDVNGTAVTGEVTIPSTGAIFIQTENFMVDCFWGGSIVTLRCVYFPATGDGAPGEACILDAACTNFPVLYEWYDEMGVLISNVNCITAASGIYTVTVTDSDNQTGSFTVDLTEGGDFGMLSDADFCAPNALYEFNDAAQLNISPNPSEGNFMLSCEACEKGSTYVIVDSMGNLIWTELLRGSHTSIDLRTVQSGIYQVMIIDRNGAQRHAGRVMVN